MVQCYPLLVLVVRHTYSYVDKDMARYYSGIPNNNTETEKPEKSFIICIFIFNSNININTFINNINTYTR